MANWKDIIAGEVVDGTSTIGATSHAPVLSPGFPVPATLVGDPKILNQSVLVNTVAGTITVFYLLQQDYKDVSGNDFFSSYYGSQSQAITDLCPQVTTADAVITLDPSTIVVNNEGTDVVQFNFNNIEITYKKCAPSKITVWAES